MPGVILSPEEIELSGHFEKLGPEKRERLSVKKPSLWRKLERAFVRVRSMGSFYDFVSYGLRNPILWEPLHRPMCDFVSVWPEGGKRKKLILEPRGHIKSNIISVALPGWMLIKDYNERILIASHKDADGSKFLVAIRTIINSDRWSYYFPEIRPKCSRGKKPDQWNDEKLLVDRDTNYVEASVEVSSIRQQVTGRHYSRVIGDDLVTPDNVATAALRAKTSDFRKLSESLMDPGATEVITGTRYHFDDEYGKILKETEEHNTYDVMHQPALYDVGIIHEYLSGAREWERSHDYEELIFPNRFTLDGKDHIVEGDPNNPKNRKSLIAIYNNMGPGHFANQYLLEPFDPANQKMSEDDLVRVTVLPDTHLTYYRLCDLSSEINSEHSDSYTAIITVAVSDRCDAYITDIFWGNYDPHLIINEMIRGQMVSPKVRPVLVTLESGPYDRMIRPFLLRRCRELGVMVPTRLMTGAQHLKRKEEHIEGIIPWLQCKKIHYLDGCKNINILKEEMNKYPKFTRRDCVDALAQLPAMIFPTGSDRFLTTPDSPEELRRMAEEMRRKELVELNEPTVIRFGDVKREIVRSGAMKDRLGNDRIRKVFKT